MRVGTEGEAGEKIFPVEPEVQAEREREEKKSCHLPRCQAFCLTVYTHNSLTAYHLSTAIEIELIDGD